MEQFLGVYVFVAVICVVAALLVASTRNVGSGRFIVLSVIAGPLGPLAAATAPEDNAWIVAENTPLKAPGFECRQCHERYSFEGASSGASR